MIDTNQIRATNHHHWRKSTRHRCCLLPPEDGNSLTIVIASNKYDLVCSLCSEDGISLLHLFKHFCSLVFFFPFLLSLFSPLYFTLANPTISPLVQYSSFAHGWPLKTFFVSCNTISLEHWSIHCTPPWPHLSYSCRLVLPSLTFFCFV